MTDIAQSLSREAHAHEKELRTEYADLFGNGRTWRNLAILTVALIASVWFAFYWLDFSLLRILNGLGRLGDFALMMMPPSSGGRFSLYLWSMMETLAIAYLGTLLAAILAFPFGFLAAKNIIPNVFLHFGIRRFLDTIRGVDTLIWALIWVSVVGLGPFAGILAIACSDFGAFGKLFSEAIEGADKKPVEGVVSSGGGRLHGYRFGVLPQVLPLIGSQVLYFFESNTRSATIIGIVGAGGIGAHLAEQIKVLNLQDVSFLIIMILIAVALIDWFSSKLRHAMIGKKAQRSA